MSIDRRQKLLMRSNALAAVGNQDLPQNVRDRYQKAADHLDVSLGLENAQQRKAQQQASLPPEQQQGENPPNLFGEGVR